MREIKFRAWNKRTNQFGRTATLVEALEFVHNNPEAIEELDYLEFSQYTGLKDKNDKEIYEGDIVKFKYNRQDKIGKVEYAICGFWVVGWLDILDRLSAHPIEVIGNIYEHPELIAGNKEE